jgi:hypothetical protein
MLAKECAVKAVRQRTIRLQPRAQRRQLPSAPDLVVTTPWGIRLMGGQDVGYNKAGNELTKS